MSATRELAGLLQGGWTTGPIATLPDRLVPADAAAAYAVQDMVLQGEAIAGWKVLPTPPHTGAPLPVSRLYADGAALPADLPRAEVEVEIAVTMARDLPARAAPYDRDEVLAACGGLVAAFEIIQSRFADRKAISPLATLADGMSSGGFGLGSGTGATAADWIGRELGEVTVRLYRDDVLVEERRGGFTTAQVVGQLVWLANHAAARGRGLQAGQAVITGARIGPRPMVPGALHRAEVDGIGAASFRF